MRAGTSGVDPTTAVLIVSLAPSANRIIQDLWKVVLTRIRRRSGADAIGEEKRSQGLTSPGSDIPPHAQKAILGRFLGFQALAPNLSTIESKGHHDIADRLIRRLCWLTNEMLDDPDSVLTPVEFLRNLLSGLEDEVRNVSDASRSAAQPVLEELGVLVAEYEAAPYDPLGKLTNAVARHRGRLLPGVRCRGAGGAVAVDLPAILVLRRENWPVFCQHDSRSALD